MSEPVGTQERETVEDIHSRLVRVTLREEDVQPLFTGQIAVVDRLPEDAKLVDTFKEPERRSFSFVFRHESFDEVPEGEVIPEVRPEYRRLEPEELDGFYGTGGGR